jgi:hypothetical protein
LQTEVPFLHRTALHKCVEMTYIYSDLSMTNYTMPQRGLCQCRVIKSKHQSAHEHCDALICTSPHMRCYYLLEQRCRSTLEWHTSAEYPLSMTIACSKGITSMFINKRDFADFQTLI